MDPVSAAINAGGAFLGSLLGYSSARESSKENRENSLEVLQKEQDYNDYLLGHQKQLMMQDAKDAGMSPSFAQGSILGASSSSPSVSPGSSVPYDYSLLGSAASDIAALLQQKPVVEANARKLNADARAQELENSDKEQKNKTLGEFGLSIALDPDTKLRIDDVDVWSAEHPGKIPNYVQLNVKDTSDGYSGVFDALQALKRWDREISDIHANMLLNEMNNQIRTGQLQSQHVYDSLVNMPFYQAENLVKMTGKIINESSFVKSHEALLNVEKASRELENRIREDSNIYQYINKMFSGKFELKDLAKVLVMSFVGLVQNIGGLSSAFRR